MRQATVAILFGLVVVAGLAALAQAPEPVTSFGNPEGLAEALDRDSAGAVSALEGILTPAQAVEFEAAMLPPPPDDTKRARYVAARKALKAAGLVKGDPALREIKTLIDALPEPDVVAVP